MEDAVAASSLRGAVVDGPLSKRLGPPGGYKDYRKKKTKNPVHKFLHHTSQNQIAVKSAGPFTNRQNLTLAVLNKVTKWRASKFDLCPA